MSGRWRAIFGDADAPDAPSEGAPRADRGDAFIELGPHPDYEGSLRGSVRRGAVVRPLAGDLDDGELLLEESANGKNITATWTGRVLDGSCGQTIEGTWNDALSPTIRRFTLKRLGSALPPAPQPADASR